jgi:hypothetical protein
VIFATETVKRDVVFSADWLTEYFDEVLLEIDDPVSRTPALA